MTQTLDTVPAYSEALKASMAADIALTMACGYFAIGRYDTTHKNPVILACQHAKVHADLARVAALELMRLAGQSVNGEG